jgi:hypothetical protein
MAFGYISNIFSPSILEYPQFRNSSGAFNTVFIIIFFILIEWIGRHGKFALEDVSRIKNKFIQLLIYYIFIFLIVLCGNFGDNSFIYFQF